MRKRFSPWFLVLTLLVCCGGRDRVSFRAGDELFSVAPDAALSVELRGERRTVRAEREYVGEPFRYVVSDGMLPARACADSTARAQAVSALLSLRVQAMPSEVERGQVQKHGSSAWLRLRVKDHSANVDPFVLELLPTPRHRAGVYAQTESGSIVVLPQSVLALWEQTCE